MRNTESANLFLNIYIYMYASSVSTESAKCLLEFIIFPTAGFLIMTTWRWTLQNVY